MTDLASTHYMPQHVKCQDTIHGSLRTHDHVGTMFQKEIVDASADRLSAAPSNKRNIFESYVIHIHDFSLHDTVNVRFAQEFKIILR